MVTATTSTTSTTSTATTATSTSTSAKTAAAGIISTLGTGSGVDVNALANGLVAAEKAPRQNELNAKVTKAESGISGYSAIKFVLNDLQTAFTNLKNQSSFSSLVPQISQPSAVSVTTTAMASAGTHSLTVRSLAQQQRSISRNDVPGFEAPDSTVNNGNTFKLLLKSGASPTPDFVKNFTNNSNISSVDLTFKAMGKGDTVTVNGLTLTANKPLSASEVSQMFEKLPAGQVASGLNTTSLATYGTFSGTFSSDFKSETSTSGALTLTANTNTVASFTPPVSTQLVNTISIAQGMTTPAGIVASINSANLGISAQLINTGSTSTPYRILVTGTSGSANSFELKSDTPVTGVNFDKPLQDAQDADFTVDGMDMKSSKNTITDAIAGTTLTLISKTKDVPASLIFSRDTSSVSSKLDALVTAYNDANTMLGVVSDPKSTVPDYGATLVGNSIVNTVRNQMRQLITGNSTTPSGGLTALRDIGFNIDQTGVLSIDKTKLDATLQTKFDNVVTLVTGNRENQSKFSVLPSGTAGEAVKKLSALLDTSGPLTAQSNNLTTKITEYKKQLADLDTRMTALLARYNKQFAAMESMVGQSKSLQTNLKSTFDGMMSVYTNK